jgi:threonine aldolase
MNKRGFASDNNAGVSSEVLAKIASVNTGHVVGYGDDPYTKQAIDLLKKQFGPRVHPYFVFTGTAANVLGIAVAVKPFQTVFCAGTAHIHVDECGAPERFAGCKLISVDTVEGKLTTENLQKYMTGFGFEHHSQPGMISISQPTELGTVYSIAEIRKLADFAHNYGLRIHMDGARLANAAVSLDCSLKEITVDAGIDVLSFGGTKNGLMAAESVLLFDESLVKEFKFIRKQGMQLASKMRFIAAQFIAYLEDGLWERNARHANAMAHRLYEALRKIPQVNITQKVSANGIFACIPKEIIAPLQREFFFYVWDEHKSEVRWMTSFDTKTEDVDEFVNRIKELIELYSGNN